MAEFSSNTRYLIDDPLMKRPYDLSTRKVRKRSSQIIGAPGSTKREAYFESIQAFRALRMKDVLRPFTVETSLKLLREHMLPPSNGSGEVVFVCIDLEFNKKFEDMIKQIGIVTMDMQEFRQANQQFSLTPTTKTYSAGLRYRLPHRYHREVACYKCKDSQTHTDSDGFVFGDTTPIEKNQIQKLIEESVQQKSPETGKDRNVILVFYGGDYDLWLLRQCGVDFLDKHTFPNLIGMVDTQKLALSSIKKTWNDAQYEMLLQPKLSNVLDCLELSPFRLHVAGHDANYTLKAMLLLACAEFREMDLTEIEKETFSDLISVAREAIPIKNTWKGPEWFTVRENRERKEIRSKTPEDWADSLDDSDGSGLSLEDLTLG